ncbi:MAG: DUF2024 family protein [Cytophagaceae bacterium]
MNVAVWDTYVKKKDGNVMHFDIIVPAGIKAELVYQYGKKYLQEINESDNKLDIEECQFCHMEEPTEEMLAAINKQGYYILQMDEIPAQLPATPTRRDLILHLRAHYKEYRFADFKGKSLEEIQSLV